MILLIITDSVEKKWGGSRSRLKENKKVLSQFTENIILGISRLTEKGIFFTLTYKANEILKFYVQSTTL